MLAIDTPKLNLRGKLKIRFELLHTVESNELLQSLIRAIDLKYEKETVLKMISSLYCLFRIFAWIHVHVGWHKM